MIADAVEQIRASLSQAAGLPIEEVAGIQVLSVDVRADQRRLDHDLSERIGRADDVYSIRVLLAPRSLEKLDLVLTWLADHPVIDAEAFRLTMTMEEVPLELWTRIWAAMDEVAQPAILLAVETTSV